MRGDLSGDVDDYSGSVKRESDRSGTPAKHSAFSTWINDELGMHGMLYTHALSAPWMSPDRTRVEMIFSGYGRVGDDFKDAIWKLVITGKRLGVVYDHLAMGIRCMTLLTADHEKAEMPVVLGTALVLVRLIEEEE